MIDSNCKFNIGDYVAVFWYDGAPMWITRVKKVTIFGNIKTENGAKYNRYGYNRWRKIEKANASHVMAIRDKYINNRNPDKWKRYVPYELQDKYVEKAV